MKSLNRILWISDYFPTPNDPTRGIWALETIVAIQKQGVEVVALSPTPWIPRWLTVSQTLRNWFGFPYEFKIKGLTVFYPKCLHYQHRFTRYLYGSVPFLDRLLIWNWCRETVSLLIDRYPFQAIHSDFIFSGGFIGLEVKKKYGLPLVVHEHSPSKLTMAKNCMLRRKVYANVLNSADIVITPSYKMANLITSIVPNISEINIIRNGVDRKTADSLVQQKPKRYKGKKIILSVGQLIKRKGQEYLIKAINEIKSEFPDIKCIIIGSGISLRNLEDLIIKLELNNIVELYGQRPHAEVLKTMSWCDVFVLTSWDEPFGTVYPEAMVYAKPIIACSGEGISEVVRDGVQALLVKKQDVESLAEALRKILSDENLASRLGREGEMLVEEELNWNHIATQIIDLCKQKII
jgi:teichuronic acid biosynthesis glycosyltransferase TuaC